MRRLLGVVRGDRKRITKVLEREKEKDIIAAVTIQQAIYICPLFWGRDSYSDFKEKN